MPTPFVNEPITVNWTEDRIASVKKGFVKVRERAQDESADVAAEELIHVVVPPEQAASSTSAGICLTPRVPASTHTRRLAPWSARWCPACRPSARISGSMPASPAPVGGPWSAAFR